VLEELALGAHALGNPDRHVPSSSDEDRTQAAQGRDGLLVRPSGVPYCSSIGCRGVPISGQRSCRDGVARLARCYTPRLCAVNSRGRHEPGEGTVCVWIPEVGQVRTPAATRFEDLGLARGDGCSRVRGDGSQPTQHMEARSQERSSRGRASRCRQWFLRAKVRGLGGVWLPEAPGSHGGTVFALVDWP
jgi:hypothetical protein